jgi:hypothetical protein
MREWFKVSPMREEFGIERLAIWVSGASFWIPKPQPADYKEKTPERVRSFDIRKIDT